MLIYSNKIFTNPVKIIEAFDNDTFREAFSQIEILKENFYLVGYIRYEAKDIFLGKNIKTDLPLLYFEVFDKFEEYEKDTGLSEIYLNPVPQISFDEYKSALEKIKEHISLGNTYQVNYTYEYLVDLPDEVSDSFDFFNKILINQKTPYNAFLKNDYEEILSFSPELFFEIQDGTIKTKPMKGTVKRGASEEEDNQNIGFLRNDIKNRAENVMIVDLLRNDLGKIAQTGSVKVDKLFEIETHKTVHQMTSDVTAQLLENISLYNVFEAIFPCGSITGAPKISTMKIIDELEKGKRDVYCGAIGMISKEKTVFSVPIRILHKKNSENSYRLRVGGAIVWDSDIADEWEETKTKIKFINPVDEFKIVETMRVENLTAADFISHIKRMKASAFELGFEFNPEIYQIKPIKDGIMRILLARNGLFEIEYRPLNDSSTSKIKISEKRVNSHNKYLRHKTTFRPWYNGSLDKILAGEIYDEIFLNENSELTEGSRTNIVVEINKKLYTSPLSSGVLNGIERQKLIEAGKCEEKKLYMDDLKKAENIYCINSVRGIKKVELQ